MELDKRIIDGKKPLDCFDTEIAKQFIGKKCYFTRDLSRFENLDGPGVYKVALTDISNHYEACYGSDELGRQQWNYARYIIPCEWVKEPKKKYRHFTNEEFLKLFDSGNVIVKKCNVRHVITKVIFYSDMKEVCVKLSDIETMYTPRSLLNEGYLICINCKWKPFGVLVEEEE